MKGHFKRIYDFSPNPKLADLFRRFAAEGLSAKIKTEFDLLASSQARKSYGGSNETLLAANLALYDIFQDGAVVKCRDEFFSLKQTDFVEAEKHLQSARAKKLLSSIELKKAFGANKQTIEEALCQFDYIETHIKLSAFLNDSQKTPQEISDFLTAEKINADQVIEALRNWLREENIDVLTKTLNALQLNGELAAQIKGDKSRVSKINFIQCAAQINANAFGALHILKRLAEDPSNYDAKFEYAKLLSSGIEGALPKDEKAAYILVKEVADSKNFALFSKKLAANFLGTLYASGKGVTKNMESAFQYFKLAADLGSVDAKCNLAVFYRDGLSIVANPIKALQLYEEAAKCESREALRILAVAFEDGEESLLIVKDLNRAADCWTELLRITPKNEETRSFIKEANQSLERISQKKRAEKKLVVEDEEISDENRLKKLIKNYKKTPDENNKKLLHDSIIAFSLEAIAANNFSDPIFSQVEALLKNFCDVDGLGLEVEIITNIKKSLISKDAKKRVKSGADLIALSSAIAQKSGENFVDPNDELFWKKAKEFLDKAVAASGERQLLSFALTSPTPFSEGSVSTAEVESVVESEDVGRDDETQQMNDFLRGPRQIKSIADLPKFLQTTFANLLEKGHQVFLKGSVVSQSNNSKRTPNDLDVDVFISGLHEWEDGSVADFVLQNFQSQVSSVYRNRGIITVSSKDDDKRIDISLYDKDKRPKDFLSWSNSKDAVRVEFDRDGVASCSNTAGFDEYLKRTGIEFNPQSDFLLNPGAHGVILRVCFLVAIEEITLGKLERALQETPNLDDLTILLDRELKLTESDAKSVEDKIKKTMDSHSLNRELRQTFINCLKTIVDMAEQQRPELARFHSGFAPHIDKVRQATKNIVEELDSHFISSSTASKLRQHEVAKERFG